MNPQFETCSLSLLTVKPKHQKQTKETLCVVLTFVLNKIKLRDKRKYCIFRNMKNSFLIFCSHVNTKLVCDKVLN